MKKLRMGIIGTGMAFEKLHYPAFQELKDKYEIAAICDIDSKKTEKWAGILQLSGNDVYTDYRAMLGRPDIDAFDILVPIELNFEITEDVARAGKPIICEKPLAPTMEQAEAAREMPRKYNVPIMIAENYRYNDEVNIIRDLVRTKKIGEVIYFMWNRVVDFPADMLGNKFPAKEWRQYPEFPGGAILDTGIHDIAALRHIFGAVDNLNSMGRKQEESFAPFSAVIATIAFKSGVIGSYTFYGSGKEMQRPLIGLRIFGTDGMVYLEERDCGTVNIAYNGGRSEQIPYQPQRGFYNELLNFYRAATGEEPLSVTPELEFGDAKMLFAILESANEHRTMQVDARDIYIPAYDKARQQPFYYRQ
ncbi:MAG: oxidoreductase [Firmicutes bacterium HGW-Firmicutes-8]|nr:MAG: oxidoreductase [Firmicutes bacterium HGW-Firmicutes-8]